MLENERHDTGSSSDGRGSNGTSGLSDKPAAKDTPHARTTRRRAAKPAAETAKAADSQAAVPAAAADAPPSAPAAPEPAGASPSPGNDQAEDGSASTRRSEERRVGKEW